MKRNEIEHLLPGVFQRTSQPGNPLLALLAVMEALHTPSEAALDQLDAFFNPYRTPDRFVPYLTRWVDMDRLFGDSARSADATLPPFPSGTGRLRELIAAAAYLSKWRGTAKGLRLFLETATGLPGYEINGQVSGSDGRPRPFHVAIRAPAQAEPYRVLIERIIEMEKPAYVTYELQFG
jgi:phage tail-like protein